jgi:hypothetical protein
MPTTEIPQDEVLNNISDNLSKVDAQRASELTNAKQLQTIINNGLVKEQTRLTAKYGANSAQVKNLTQRISYFPKITAVLDQEITRSGLTAPAFDGTSWQISGRVFDSTGKPVQNITVFLTQDGKTAIDGIPFSCSTDQGIYAINVSTENAAKLKNVTTLKLGASDSNQKLLYTSADTFTPAPGSIQSYSIYIGSMNCTAPPAGNAPGTGSVPTAGNASVSGDLPSAENTGNNQVQ